MMIKPQFTGTFVIRILKQKSTTLHGLVLARIPQ